MRRHTLLVKVVCHPAQSAHRCACGAAFATVLCELERDRWDGVGLLYIKPADYTPSEDDATPQADGDQPPPRTRSQVASDGKPSCYTPELERPAQPDYP